MISYFKHLEIPKNTEMLFFEHLKSPLKSGSLLRSSSKQNWTKGGEAIYQKENIRFHLLCLKLNFAAHSSFIIPICLWFENLDLGKF